ncbi:PRC-barrel domain containing protein [Halobellus rarus]|uniref:PRC-barrel domain containing protein n=1 Tax=Halobellus rarus TaxID=1126237 RepID=A0ABD6CSX4_9EURY|nr:PRC-barrel domain containing protein [Halobellus rarus]
MQDNVTLTEDDEGKNVVNYNGDQVGRVIEVEHGKAHVDPDPGLADTIKSKLGWGEGDEEDYLLDSSRIERVSDDEIHLRR